MFIKPQLKTELQQYARYLDGYRLDYEHFDVVDIIPQDKEFAATIMHDHRADAYKPWCVQYHGGGHYFFTREELDDYCHDRKFY
ncbi:MAG: hypothetical protein LBJ12_03070 [Oscillospiraceae bacterium]|jgi:acetyl esterase/lipase|nr:hypothetical protein [Oscillospiraceae bacterium]